MGRDGWRRDDLTERSLHGWFDLRDFCRNGSCGTGLYDQCLDGSYHCDTATTTGASRVVEEKGDVRLLYKAEEAVVGIQRRVALIGSGIGPWISTQGLREPRAKVTGLKTGGELCVAMSNEPNPEASEWAIRTFQENGVHELRESRWMRVACANGGRNVICDILTKKAVA